MCEEENLSSCSEKPISCFGFVRRKKRRTEEVETDSTSIADTESWTTEEIIEDEDEYVLDVEIEDFENQKDFEDFDKKEDENFSGSERELLPTSRSKRGKKRKRRFKGILSIVKAIFSSKKVNIWTLYIYSIIQFLFINNVAIYCRCSFILLIIL